MLRDKRLIPLSRQHQHALALCVRLDRALQAGPIDPEPWQAEMAQIFEQEITIHFAAEEKEVFPAAANFPELQLVVQELFEEHRLLRDLFARAQSRDLDRTALSSFATALAQHIRKEERQLFEGMQKLMSATELETIGAALERELEAAINACRLPNPSTRDTEQ
ncbi:MAG TPA: hemerythrin domain-containing protein [Terriglobales bacterium]|jgi:hemerythrin-like domain-containing protein|nr:hemerythrin domain-containing protein [Terriglobales bacterium]